METRVAIISIIVEEGSATDEVNAVLHEFNSIIIGRMGIPYRKKDIGIISIAVDGAQDTINTLAGNIGKIDGVSAKTVYSQK
ncbi:MAG: iron-only hydrogenase system regulator [Clostridia bacterium]|nr:iron-only hydrogenase system regulator [Clostridia bacterium]